MNFKPLRIFLNKPLQAKWLVLDAACTLVWFALFVRLMPFQRLSAKWGSQGQVARTDITTDQQQQAREIEWLIEALSRRMPFQATCLMQAATAKSMLKRRGVPSTVYIGVAPRRDDGRNVNAHAWLQCGERIITGRAEARNFRAMTWFS